MTRVYLIILILSFIPFSHAKEKKIISAYLPLWKVWAADDVPGHLVTHIKLAFARISDKGEAEIDDNERYQTQMLQALRLKQLYPHIKLILSVGGGEADGFSDMGLTTESRQQFIESLTTMIGTYQLDGIDIDWEYPGHNGWGKKVARSEDKKNFTALMADIRLAFDELEKTTGKYYQLSYAAGTQIWSYQHTEVDKISQYVDHINIMGYDFFGPWGQIGAHHANLFANRDNPINPAISVDQAVSAYLAMGVPSDKLVLGIPFYGYSWTDSQKKQRGLFQPFENPIPEAIEYKDLVRRYSQKKGFSLRWDDDAKADYLFDGKTFITFDGARAVTEKGRYVKRRNLAGAMVWELTQDHGQDLLSALHSALTPEFTR
ncbi:glycoside hydrolase family 18 protein [Veronia pacifica]|uniref:chitinase n=1 Tax=Veronia pacifica TaxID=1080227 RepID=A0A1C3ECF3_9GAMM|nr:glycoside hydrolase family 18 protein [Veronia pacifica]ODA30913.1 hypothetical protein A8L45_18745 [Veronia pacifica]